MNYSSIVDRAVELEALQGSGLQLMALLSGEDWQSSDIADVLRHDTALTGRLLSLANSAGVGVHGHVDSVHDA